MDRQVVISIRTVIFTLLMLFAAYVVYKLRGIIILLLISVLLVISLEPLIKSIMKAVIINRNISRSVAVILSYVLLISALAVLFTIGLPLLVVVAGQIQLILTNVFTNLGVILQRISETYGIEVSFQNFAPQASQISGNFLSFTISVFSNLLNIITVLFLSIWMSLDWENLKKWFVELFPQNYKDTVKDIVMDIEQGVGHWVKGQLFLMLVVGFLSYLGLLALQVEYAPALGILAGLLEIVPILGPVVSAVLAASIAAADSPLKGAAVLGLFLIIQQLENNFLVPKIMQKVSGFSPLVILLALMIGSSFFGIVGAILSIPLFMIMVIIIKKVLTYSSQERLD